MGLSAELPTSRTLRTLRLYPPPEREVPQPYEGLEDLRSSSSGRDAARPYVLLNAVSSVDAQISAGGKAAPLGSAVDRAAMRYLRSKADAVMVGAGTLRAERLSLGLDPEVYPDVPQPRAIILSESGEVPLGENLIPHEGQSVSILSTRPMSIEGADLIVAPRLGGGEGGGLDLPAALGLLRREHAVQVLLVEGGPTLHNALISRGLVDELFLTLAPMLVGAPALEPLSNPARGQSPQTAISSPRPLQLLGAYLADAELFVRYRVRRT